MIDALRPTPFHARTAEHNLANAWVTRGGFSVPAHYVDPQLEALAPRLSAAMIDISAQQDLRIEGEGAAALLSAACGAAVRGMSIGQSENVCWCADGGGLRGFGVVLRLSEQDFVLRSTDADLGWFASAAARFGATLSDVTAERGLLLLAGRYALPVMVAAKLEIGALEAGRHAQVDWGGIAVTVFHCNQLDGYEVSCAASDATLVFDRLFRAGRLVGLRLAGEDAMQLLQLEAGLPLAHVDFTPARENFASMPSPPALGFKDTLGAGETAPAAVLAGLELRSEKPMPFAPVFSAATQVGRCMRSLYSPALRSAIALAQLTPQHAVPGTILTVRHFDKGAHNVPARVVKLPFL